MADFSEMLQQLLQSDEGKQGLAQAMEILGGGTPSAPEKPAAPDMPFDPQMLVQLQNILSAIPKQDKNTDFLRALKPLLKPERQAKADEAIKMMRMFSMLPALQKSGLLNKLF